uniref:Uncharacterized protein n=1 Tax=Ralstonia solanacearum TaxID=305 RepID=A0A0S4TXE5_RALSL|nr:protein of unknown function [Ralstonia solanacearum]
MRRAGADAIRAGLFVAYDARSETYTHMWMETRRAMLIL